MLDARALGLVVRFELRRLVRSRHGLLTVLSFLGLYGGLAALLPMIDEVVADFFSQAKDQVSHGAQGVSAMMLTQSEAPLPAFGAVAAPTLGQAQAVLEAHPAVLVFLFLVLLAATPSLAMLAGFDQLASDIANKHIRFLLVRTSRSTLLVGRFVATWLFFALALGLGSVLAALVMPFGDHGLQGLEGVFYLFRIWATVCVYAAPFLAFLSLTGVILGRPIASLAAAFAASFALFILSDVIGAMEGGESWRQLGWIWPSAMKYHLLLTDIPSVAAAAGHCLGLTAIFGGLSGWWLHRRDL